MRTEGQRKNGYKHIDRQMPIKMDKEKQLSINVDKEPGT
jgi:hypothetical protein